MFDILKMFKIIKLKNLYLCTFKNFKIKIYQNFIDELQFLIKFKK